MIPRGENAAQFYFLFICSDGDDFMNLRLHL